MTGPERQTLDVVLSELRALRVDTTERFDSLDERLRGVEQATSAQQAVDAERLRTAALAVNQASVRVARAGNRSLSRNQMWMLVLGTASVVIAGMGVLLRIVLPPS